MLAAGFKTPAALAKALRVSYSTVQRWFADSLPRESMLEAVAKLLKVSPHWLATGDGERGQCVTQQDMVRTVAEEDLGGYFVGGFALKDSGVLQQGIERAMIQLERANDPTVRAALAVLIQKLAHGLEREEMQKIAAGMPES